MKTIAFLTLGFFVTTSLLAQNAFIKKDSLYSEVLDEQRHVNILYPKNHKPDSGEKYAAIYLLDGPWNQELVGTIRDFIRVEKHMPPSIVVSIVNVDRNRDFLPSHNERVPTSGGADKFLAFLQTELMPFMGENYPVNGEDILLGHSFGGVFTMYALLEEPELFDAYLAGDPSFWWDDGYMVDLAAEKLPSLEGHPSILFVAGRKDHHAYSGMGIDRMDSVLQIHKPDDLHWKSVAYENETHGTSRLKHAYDGLRYVYDGYGTMQVDFHPMNGIIQKEKPLTIWNASGSKTMHYTTDGSEPTLDSPLFPESISLSEPGILKVKSISPHGNFSSDLKTGSFTEEKAPPAIKKIKKAKAGGFRYSIYRGEWDELPDFQSLKAVEQGIAREYLNLDSLPDKNFACVMEGYLRIETEGYYLFALGSDDGSRIYLGDRKILDNDGLHAADESKSFALPLEAGYYPIRLEYFQKGGGKALNLLHVPPGANRPSTIPIEMLYYSE